jgi:hypothetical protein
MVNCELLMEGKQRTDSSPRRPIPGIAARPFPGRIQGEKSVKISAFLRHLRSMNALRVGVSGAVADQVEVEVGYVLVTAAVADETVACFFEVKLGD